MAKAIGSIDMKPETEASGTATKYITEINNDGITVHDENSSTDYLHITSSMIDIVTNSVSAIKAWVENAVAKIRIGSSNSTHVEINNNGMYVKDVEDASTLSVFYNKLTSSTITIGSTSGSATNYVIELAGSSNIVELPSVPKTGTAIKVGWGDMSGSGTPIVITVTAGTSSSGTSAGLLTYSYDATNNRFTFGESSGDNIWYITYTIATKYLPRINIGSDIKMGQIITSGLPNSVVRVDNGSVRINNTEKYRRLSNVDQIEGKPSYVNSLLINGRDMFGGGKVLWQSTSGYYMTANQTVSLNEPISSQPHGIILVWSGYTPGTGVTNSAWHMDFIPKYIYDFTEGGFGLWTGQGVYCSYPTSLTGNKMRNKYVYISDDEIRGNASNSAYDSAGQTYDNRQAVLRLVIGI